MRKWVWPAALCLPLIWAACGKKSETPVPAAGNASPTEDLPSDPEEKYRTAYVRSAQAFARNDLVTAIEFLKIAEQAKPGQANTANLRGAIYTRQRDWPKAQASFEEALQLQPNLPMAQFNLGEVLFLNQKYAEARERFQIFVNSQPENDLGRYKMYLCDLLGNNPQRAKEFLQTLRPDPDSPIYYFAYAAEAFVSGRKTEAMDLVASAYRIYSIDANATFADSLVEKGYLQGDQAEKIPDEDDKAEVTELPALLPELKKEGQQGPNHLSPPSP